MNALFLQLGFGWLKPFATALLLPPVPFLLLAVVGLLELGRRRRSGATLIGLAVVAIWFSGCTGVADRLGPLLLPTFPAIDDTRIDALRREAAGRSVAIVILGGGLEEWAPEYGSSNLRFASLERLRYGLWLQRRTGWPTAFSGGVGWGQPDEGAAREASVAQRIATVEFRQPLRWIEDASRDTLDNARRTAALLKPIGVTHVVLVTHDWHMARASRNFKRAFGPGVDIDPAPMGLATDLDMPLLRWVPSGDGITHVRNVVREWLGLLAGS